ncbi:N-acetylneuraminic acid mutarotase [Anseongella ginsenosidimutans]|uniref:N-acetylneuraminic acid mutarotase n=1 Tax=Anseongella ginsenosidimutans TaxID=496056 RepID=A0A4R3KTG4_9SPHI|nr:kelch repeat-containing protein [Anseongella ginsenosidimutans]QEC53550.1 hypothetical protein FRZ59_15210 [Anseongella ginsenosidimutans]TCS88454.1 N-acetylneuraminic acid mutarotase [Anseongella ginsenosidimutans]
MLIDYATIFRYLLVCLLLMSLWGCKKEHAKDNDRVTTYPVSEADSTGVVFRGFVMEKDIPLISELGFVWSENPNPDINDAYHVSALKPEAGGEFSIKVSSGIKKNVTYYVRAYAILNGQFLYSNPQSFEGKGSSGPRINRLIPYRGTWGDTLQIVGTNYSTESSQVEVYLEELPLPVLSAGPDTIKCLIPDSFNKKAAKVVLTVNGQTTQFSAFYLTPPRIDSLSDYQGRAGERIRIYGDYFSPVRENNLVKVNDKNAAISSNGTTYLEIELPVDNYSSRKPLTVEVAGNVAASELNFELLVYLTRMPDFPGKPRFDATGVVTGNKAYIGTGRAGSGGEVYSYGDIWEYDLVSGAWKPKTNYPEGAANSLSSFTLNGKIYMGTGVNMRYYSNNYYEYDPLGNSWKQIANFPSIPRVETQSFVIGEKAYVGGGFGDSRYLSDYYSYTPETNSWERIADMPAKEYVRQASFVLNGKFYIGTGLNSFGHYTNEFWVYDPLSDKWSRAPDFPGELRQNAIGFSIKGKGYIYGGHQDHHGVPDIWEFSPETGEWTKKENIVSKAHWLNAFFIANDKAYIITGAYNTPYSSFSIFSGSGEFWIFEP